MAVVSGLFCSPILLDAGRSNIIIVHVSVLTPIGEQSPACRLF